MMPFSIRPDQAVQELVEFNRKLAEGLKNLYDMDEIETGVTPKDAIYREDKLVLYHFRAPDGRAPRNKVPLLIVYALVNRPYMTDLQEDRSMVRGLLEAGQDVYLVDWGYPDQSDRFLTLDDYINGYVDRCVDVVRRRHGLDSINLLGICQGGTFSLCYAALHRDKVRNLITMVTPVDFKTPDNLLSHWSQHVDVDLVVDTLGNVPGELLNWTYLSLKPYRLMGQKYLQMVDQLDKPGKAKGFMRMEKWIFDSPDQAGEAFRQFMKDFFQENKLIKGEVDLGGRRVDLADITMPVLNIYAKQDHLVPPKASIPLQSFVGTKDYTEIAFKGGHIGIYVSGSAQREVPPAVGRWLDERG
jgi:polyhydroxyalkanoate synthase